MDYNEQAQAALNWIKYNMTTCVADNDLYSHKLEESIKVLQDLINADESAYNLAYAEGYREGHIEGFRKGKNERGDN